MTKKTKEEHAVHCKDPYCYGCECTPECDYWGEQQYYEGSRDEQERIVAELIKDDSPVWEGNVQQNLISLVRNEEFGPDIKGYCRKHEIYFDADDNLKCPACQGAEEERQRILKLLDDHYETWLSKEGILPSESILEAARLARLGTVEFFTKLINGEIND